MKRFLTILLALLLTLSMAGCGGQSSESLPSPASSVPLTDSGSAVRVAPEVAGQISALGEGELLVIAAVINTDTATAIPTLPQGVDVMMGGPNDPTLYIRGTREQLLALAENQYIDDLLPAPAGLDTSLLAGFAATLYAGDDPLDFGDQMAFGGRELRCGTQAELDAFLTLLGGLNDRAIVDFSAGRTPAETPAKADVGATDAARLLAALRCVKPVALSKMENPATGGSVWVRVKTPETEFSVTTPGNLYYLSYARADACLVFGVEPQDGREGWDTALTDTIAELVEAMPQPAPAAADAPEEAQSQMMPAWASADITDGAHLTQLDSYDGDDSYTLAVDTMMTLKAAHMMLAPAADAPALEWTPLDGGFALDIDFYVDGNPEIHCMLYPDSPQDGWCVVRRSSRHDEGCWEDYCIPAEVAARLVVKPVTLDPAVEAAFAAYPESWYPEGSSPWSVAKLRAYLAALPQEQALSTLEDDELVYSMLMDYYWR